MTIAAEQATVYRGGRRRWLSLRAACRAEAKAKLRTRCECDSGDEVTPGYQCQYHGDDFNRYVNKLAAIYERAYKDQS